MVPHPGLTGWDRWQNLFNIEPTPLRGVGLLTNADMVFRVGAN